MRNLFLASVLALTAGSAQAVTISYNFTSPTEGVDLFQTGSLPLFNPALGTLTGVTVTVGANATASFSATNQSSVPFLLARVTRSVELYYSSSLSALNGLLTQLTPSFSNNTGQLGYGAGQSRNFGPFNHTDTNVFTAPNAGTLSQFTGVGNFSVSLETFSGTTIAGGGGNVVVTDSTTGNLFGSVTYDYLAVPESASWAMLIAGFGLTGAATRRRRTGVAAA